MHQYTDFNLYRARKRAGYVMLLFLAATGVFIAWAFAYSIGQSNSTILCKPNETGTECQAHLGDKYEVLQAGSLIWAEKK